MITLIIVEDNPRAAELFKELIERDEEFRVTGIYSSGEAALEAIPGLPLPDLALIDIGLPGISGIELTSKLKDRFPRLEIIIQTVFEEEAKIVEAIRAGASAYILKASTRDEVLWALREVKNKRSYLSGIVARKVIEELKKDRFSSCKDNGITTREREILDKLISGASYKAIASELNLSIHTVNSHIRSIYEKLHVSSRGEAVAKMITP